MTNAGLDASQFGAHSTHASSTPAAKNSGLSMATITKAAGWSNASTFASFYNERTEQRSTSDFSQAILYSVSEYFLCSLKLSIFLFLSHNQVALKSHMVP